jgi:hypothetical protein
MRAIIRPGFQMNCAALRLTGNTESENKGAIQLVILTSRAPSLLYFGDESHSSHIVFQRPFPGIIKEKDFFCDITVVTPFNSLQYDDGHNTRMGSTNSPVTSYTH